MIIHAKGFVTQVRHTPHHDIGCYIIEHPHPTTAVWQLQWGVQGGLEGGGDSGAPLPHTLCSILTFNPVFK